MVHARIKQSISQNANLPVFMYIILSFKKTMWTCCGARVSMAGVKSVLMAELIVLTALL